jgi:hypothetical protein
MAGLGKAVQQHDGIALAGDEIVELDAVDVGKSALRRLRQRRPEIEGRDRQRRQRGSKKSTKGSQAARHCDFLILR